MVAERAVEELAAALDVSYGSACGLVAGALELRYRLPRLWALVQAGPVAGVEGPQGRQQTTHLGSRGGGVRRRPGRDRRREEPDRAQPDRARPPGAGAVRARQGHASGRKPRGRTATSPSTTTTTTRSAPPPSPPPWTSWTPTTSTPPSSDVANQLGRLGDQSPLGHRRAAALGLLAHPQRVLDLFGATRPTRNPHRARTLAITGATLYVHLTGDDLRRTAEDGETTPADVEKLGTATLDLLKTWLQRFSGITLKPVLDMGTRRRRGPARPTRLDARPRHPARRPLRLPRLQHRRPPLRPRPHRPLRPDRRRRTTRPNQRPPIWRACAEDTTG